MQSEGRRRACGRSAEAAGDVLRAIAQGCTPYQALGALRASSLRAASFAFREGWIKRERKGPGGPRRASNPVWGPNTVLGGFDSHTFPPWCCAAGAAPGREPRKGTMAMGAVS